MTREAVFVGVAGTVFGVLVGWIIGTQQVAPVAPAAPPAQAAAPAAGQNSTAPPPFDAARGAELERRAAAEPANASVRVDLGNLYFDAERFDQSIPWYEAAYKLDAKNVSVSTDLALAYFYTQQIDRSLAQLERSLAIDPKHLKSLLNQGYVLAFGKKDLAAAAEAWKKLVAIAPDSEEGRRAQQGLDGISAAHQNSGATSGAGATTR
jgi:tetratricopeptide (TPR) repeat protein